MSLPARSDSAATAAAAPPGRADREPGPAGRPARGGGGASVAVAAGVGVLGVATVYARRVVTPDAERPDDVEVLAVGAGTVTLARDRRDGGARPLRPVAGRRRGARPGGRGAGPRRARPRVTRRVLGVDRGRLAGAPPGGTSTTTPGPPRRLGLPYEDVRGAGGARHHAGLAGARRRPAVRRRDTWAVLVHGRGARREECLRAVPVTAPAGLHGAGPMYRNDTGAPPSPDGRYNLGTPSGATSRPALLYAAEPGRRRDRAGGVVDGRGDRAADRGPVVGGRPGARRRPRRAGDRLADVLAPPRPPPRVPAPVGRWPQPCCGAGAARRLLGVRRALTLGRLDWVRRAAELRVPLLIVHSEDDEFVPAGPSRRAGRRAPRRRDLRAGARRAAHQGVERRLGRLGQRRRPVPPGALTSPPEALPLIMHGGAIMKS